LQNKAIKNPIPPAQDSPITTKQDSESQIEEAVHSQTFNNIR